MILSLSVIIFCQSFKSYTSQCPQNLKVHIISVSTDQVVLQHVMQHKVHKPSGVWITIRSVTTAPVCSQFLLLGCKYQWIWCPTIQKLISERCVVCVPTPKWPKLCTFPECLPAAPSLTYSKKGEVFNDLVTWCFIWFAGVRESLLIDSWNFWERCDLCTVCIMSPSLIHVCASQSVNN